MDYKITELEEMIFITSEGSDREIALSNLNGYLKESNISSEGYYFIEVFTGGKVSGAMALAKVKTEPERNKKFRSSVLKSGTYLIFDLPYEVYVETNKTGSNKEIDIKGYLKEKGYRVSGFPFFEFLKDTNNEEIRVYVPIK